MKRFYTAVAAAETEHGHIVLLDERPVKTPAKNLLALPSHALAEAIGAEWHAQVETIRPHQMPLTRLASTAIDRVASNREAVAEQLGKFAETDLLCYRSAHPVELVERETRAFQPLLDWATLRFDAPLAVTTSAIPVLQPPDSLRALHHELIALDAFALTAIADLAATCGSLILALAVRDGRIDAAGAGAIAVIGETFQEAQWGEDREAIDRRRAVQAELHAAARFLELLKSAG